MNFRSNYSLLTLFGALALVLSALCKTTWLIGHYSISLTQIIGPALGLVSLSSAASAIFIYVLLMASIKGFAALTFFTTFGLPTLVAATFLSQTYKNLFKSPWLTTCLEVVVRVVCPLLAALVFISHPVGREAYAYTFLWAIPVILYGFELCTSMIGRYSVLALFSQALTATFLAHMVGSIIYLYRFSFTASYWISLIPVVMVERIILASAIVALPLAFSSALKLKARLKVFLSA